MQSIIAFIDDPDWAQRQLSTMAGCEGTPPTRWVLVACPPPLTRHAARWISREAREAWRQSWSDELFARVEPALRRRGHAVLRAVATPALAQLTARLVREHGAAHVLDARRPRFARSLPPVTAEQAATGAEDRWQLPLAVAGVGAMLALAAE